MVPLTLRPIDAEQHHDFLRSHRDATAISFLQTPAWAQVKKEWRGESIGWFDGAELVGVGLVLYRQLPKVKRYFAYLPEGPAIDWSDRNLGRWLEPLAAYLKAQGAFSVRIGPPVVTRRWSAQQIKDGVADAAVRSLTELPPSLRDPIGAQVVSQLRDLGWRGPEAAAGFAAGQPAFNFVIDLAGRTEDEVLRGMNQLWRRNIKKAAKEGVEVTVGERADLAAFHELYVHTAQRDGFTPRPLSYFETMYDALHDPNGTGSESGPVDLRLYLARHDGDLVASTIWIRVGRHAWYSYGASSTHKREVRGSNAIQWRMITDALAAGAAVYDLRGITATLDAEDPHVGLIQFKVGTGGEAIEYPGEWDLPLNRLLDRAFQLYLKRRG